MKRLRISLITSGVIFCILFYFSYNKVPVSQAGEWAEEIPVLVYHHLLRNEENPFKKNSAIVSVEKFQEQMDYLYENGYYTITLEELERFVKGEIRLPKRSVLITFDDGYKSNYKYAYPILKEYGYKATIFVVSGWIRGETVPFDPHQIQYLSWEEVEDSKDVFQYACHTYDFHRLGENKQSYVITKPLGEVKADLRKSSDILDTTYFAYPYGHYNEQTLEALKELGYTMAFTVKSGTVKPGDNLLELNRYGIFSGTSLRAFKARVGM